VVEPRQSDINWILIAGLLQPFATEILTEFNVKPGIKRVVNFVLSAMVGTANALYEDQQNGGPFDWKRAMIVTLGVWATSATAYVHLWKDTAVLNKVDEATAGFGVGTQNSAEPVQPVPVAPPPVPDTHPPVSSGLADVERARVEAAAGFHWTIQATPVTPIAGPPPPPPAPARPQV